VEGLRVRAEDTTATTLAAIEQRKGRKRAPVKGVRAKAASATSRPPPPKRGTAPLPLYVRYRDLVERGVFRDWNSVLSAIELYGFPSGVHLTPHVRAWRLDEVEAWLASRPSAPLVSPGEARQRKYHARQRKATAAAP
jgi:hypothetical protein